MRALGTGAVAAAALAGCDTQSPAERQVAAPRPFEREIDTNLAYAVVDDFSGRTAPTTAFTTPDGKRATIADFAGRPVLVNLWATWCAPCVKEMPTLDALAAREGDRLAVLAISQDTRGAAVVDPFLAKRKFSHLAGNTDPDNALSSAFGVAQLPVSILFDAKGREVLRVLGGMSWDGDRAAELLDRADAG